MGVGSLPEGWKRQKAERGTNSAYSDTSTAWRLYAHVVSVDDVPRERSSERPILSQTDLSAAYKSRPLGRLGVEAVNFLRNSWLRSLLASLLFRSRWKRALSPLSADMVTQA